ncbi:MAG TPA: glutamine synthetase family protein [Hyphomicrobium sp.]|nr:glutamine synthetase family protein [Hyphomicrobium sp.]
MIKMPAKDVLAQEARAFLDANPDIGQFAMLYTDLAGVQRGKLLTRGELMGAYQNGRCLPGSVMSLDITGRDVEETGMVWADGDADRLVWPVAGTLVRTPWARTPQAQYLGSFFELNGDACLAEPRHALQRVIGRLAELSLTPVAAVELEFYLLDRESALAGRPHPPAALAGGAEPKYWQAYFMPDIDDFAPFFDELYAAAKVQGVPAEALISEYSPAQMEIGLRHHDDALRACDEAMMFKRAVKCVADKHGLMATFMAKPYSQCSGSGMHLHVSLAGPGGANAFASDEVANELLRFAIGGMQATMADAMAIFAPNANSYRRFRKSSYAPVAPNWGINNRTVSLRVPATSGAARHVEHRTSGADANPYLALACVLAGMHYGIVNRIDPGPPVTGNGYEQPGATPIPVNWFSALEKMRASEFMKSYFGARFVDIFTTIKEIEADRFFAEPQPLDFDFYLRTV